MPAGSTSCRTNTSPSWAKCAQVSSSINMMHINTHFLCVCLCQGKEEGGHPCLAALHRQAAVVSQLTGPPSTSVRHVTCDLILTFHHILSLSRPALPASCAAELQLLDPQENWAFLSWLLDERRLQFIEKVTCKRLASCGQPSKRHMHKQLFSNFPLTRRERETHTELVRDIT